LEEIVAGYLQTPSGGLDGIAPAAVAPVGPRS
jgi:hypothetical protein